MLQNGVRLAVTTQWHSRPERIIRKLADVDKMRHKGQDIAEVSPHLVVAESMWHRWKVQMV